MTLVKDDATAKLDAVGRAGMEAIGLFEDLAGRLEDPALRESVASHAAAQRRLLERMAGLRRSRGEMPQAADPERPHLEAAGAFARAALLGGDASEHYVESLLDAATKVGDAVDAALALELPTEIRGLLESFKRDNDQFRHTLRGRG